ncbi:MAG: hypothetical protein ACNA8P_10810 [Phycisphaerales bacterium]
MRLAKPDIDSRPQFRVSTLLAAVAGLSLGGVASAQDALGAGDALDANPQVGSGGFNPLARDWQSEIAFRNAIVTGNVGGGREFRGNLGYSGVGDFRGALGSDMVFNFQRDSFYSGLATRRIRGIEATTIQFQGPTAGLRDGVGGLSGGMIINRPGAGTTARQVATGSTPQALFDELRAFDQINNTLRSTTAHMVRDASRPHIMGSASDGTNNFFITASPLGGIDARDPLDPSLISGRSYRPEEFDFDPRISIPGFRERAIEDRRLLDQIQDAEAIAERMPGHNRVLEDLRTRALDRGLLTSEDLAPAGDRPSQDRRNIDQRPTQPTTPSGRPEIEFPDIDSGIPGSMLDRGQLSGQGTGSSVSAVDDLDRLLREFSGALESAAPTLGPSGYRPGGPELGPTRLRRTEDPLARDPREVDRDLTEQTMERMIDLLRDQTVTISRISPGEDTSLYAQHMRAGERLLSEGMWFIAEERFVAALSSRQGDAMAAIGRAHAQIGAGLYLSAAVNLSDLLRAYPELITVRYERSLLPGHERLDRIRQQLRGRSVDNDANARNAGFLLAYLGYHTDRPGDVREGFAVVERVNKALGTETDPLIPVLAELWSQPRDGDRETDR